MVDIFCCIDESEEGEEDVTGVASPTTLSLSLCLSLSLNQPANILKLN